MHLYKKYKRIKNKIKATKLDESLYVIWNYVCLLYERDVDFNKNGVETNLEFLKSDYLQKRRWLAEWDTQILIREVIINSQEFAYKPKTFRKWKYFADTKNLLGELSDNISKIFISKDNVLMEMHRIAHRQFPWQIRNANQIYLTRYFKIFSDKKIKNIVEIKLGMPINKFYFVVLIIYSHFLDQIAINYPPKIDVKNLTLEEVEKVINFMSITLEELRKKFIDNHKVDANFNYILSQSQIYPIIKMNYFGKYSLVCPDSKLLFWRATDGLYYELFNEDNFDIAFGESFENYVGEVIKKTLKKINFIKELEYGASHSKKKSSDWIIYDKESIVFIECKTKRMKNESKINIVDTASLYKDLNKMSDFIVQVYKTIKDYKDNLYNNFSYNEKLKIYPMVVTLENWHFFGLIYNETKKMVINKLIENNLPVSWVEEMPFTVCSVDTFEVLTQVINTTGINTVFDKKTKGQEKEYDFSVVLNNNFKSEIDKTNFLFEEDFDMILPKKLYS